MAFALSSLLFLPAFSRCPKARMLFSRSLPKTMVFKKLAARHRDPTQNPDFYLSKLSLETFSPKSSWLDGFSEKNYTAQFSSFKVGLISLIARKILSLLTKVAFSAIAELARMKSMLC